MPSSSGLGSNAARVLTKSGIVHISPTVYFYTHNTHVMEFKLRGIYPCSLSKFEAEFVLLSNSLYLDFG